MNEILYDSKYKLKLIKKIDLLDYNEKCEIYNIIKKDTDKVTENNNGVFINLKHIKDDTITKMSEFIDYCVKNKENMKNDENKIEKNTSNNLNKTQNDIETISKTYNLNPYNEKKNQSFLFKTYIDKISTLSNSYFENNSNTTLNPTIKTNRINFDGIKARLYNKCKNINKETIKNSTSDEIFKYDFQNYETYDYNLNNLKNKSDDLHKELNQDLNYL